jgi:hypothetical protein
VKIIERCEDVGTPTYLVMFPLHEPEHRIGLDHREEHFGITPVALRWALRSGLVPREIYLDIGKQFIAKVFKAEAQKYGIKLVFGRPYNPRGRGKIERYHRTLYQELISLKVFHSLSHFKRELWNFDQQYNNWRKQEILGWTTPTSVYHNEINFDKTENISKTDKNSVNKMDINCGTLHLLNSSPR